MINKPKTGDTVTLGNGEIWKFGLNNQWHLIGAKVKIWEEFYTEKWTGIEGAKPLSISSFPGYADCFGSILEEVKAKM